MKADSVRLQRQPLIAPSDVRSDGVGGREAKVGTPFGARLRAIMHKVFSRSRASVHPTPLAERGVQVAKPLPSRKERAAQKKLDKQVGEMMAMLKTPSENAAGSRLAVNHFLNELPKTTQPLIKGDNDNAAVLGAVIRDQLLARDPKTQGYKLSDADIRMMQRNLADGMIGVSHPDLPVLQSQLNAGSDRSAMEWHKAFGYPRPKAEVSSIFPQTPNPALRADLRAFLESEFSTENLDAIEKLESILASPDPLDTEKVTAFMEDHIGQGAPFQINISSVQEAALRNATNNAEFRSALQDACAEIKKLTATDAGARFVKLTQPPEKLEPTA